MKPEHSVSRRHHLRQLASFGLATACSPYALAQTPAYPNRPVRWIIPYGAGGGTDGAARLIAKHWEPTLGASLVIDNKPGGQTIIATQALQTAAPDGYTIMAIVDNYPLLPLMFKSLPFDIEKDFEFVSTTVKVPFFLAVRADSPVRSFQEAMVEMRTKGDKMNYATYGVGSMAHLAMEALCDRMGIKMTHIPYQGAAAQNKALLAGEVDITFVDTLSALPFLKDGRIRVLGMSVKDRVPTFANIPTLHEQGIAGFDYYSWHGILMPRNTPRPVVNKVAQTLQKTMASAEIRKEFTDRGWEVFTSSPDEFRKHVNFVAASMRNLIDKRGIKITAD